MIRTLAFDLDNTLYDEAQFLNGGIEAVSVYLGSRYHVGISKARRTLQAICQVSGRESMMTDAIRLFKLPDECLPEMIRIYRTHTPKLSLYEDYKGLLAQLTIRYRLSVITDGMVQVQENKVRVLGLHAFMNPIIYSWKDGPQNGKPSPSAFRKLVELTQNDAWEIAYIGDNPAKDFLGARQVGLHTIRVLTGPHRADPVVSGSQPDHTIQDLLALPELLADEFSASGLPVRGDLSFKQGSHGSF